MQDYATEAKKGRDMMLLDALIGERSAFLSRFTAKACVVLMDRMNVEWSGLYCLFGADVSW